MKKEDFFNLGLPKWPCLIVKGKPVTQDQAKEIILRTDSFSFCSNDRQFEKEINQLIYGFKVTWSGLYDEMEKAYGKNHWEKTEEIKKSYRIIDLEYLNNSQILSSWIGGPHGWCNWSGYIGANNYNIGKYPDVKTIYNEWKSIAKEFTFLDLKCQLMNGESCEEKIRPVVEFTVKSGKVRMIDPKEILDYPNEGNMLSNLGSIFGGNPFRERGCTIDTLRDALFSVKN